MSIGIQHLHRASPPFPVTCYLFLCLLAYNTSTECLHPSLLPICLFLVAYDTSTERLHPSLLPVTYFCVYWHTTPPQSVLTLPCYLLPICMFLVAYDTSTERLHPSLLPVTYLFVSSWIRHLHRASPPFPVTCYLCVCFLWHTTPPQNVLTLPCYLLPICLFLVAYDTSTERLHPSLLPVTYMCD